MICKMWSHISVITFCQPHNRMFQSFKLSFLSIIKVISLRCLVSKAHGYFSKSTGESLSWILSSISNKSCCTTSCCSQQSVTFAFFFEDRVKGWSFWCFSIEVKLLQGYKIGQTPWVNRFREKMLLTHSSEFADSWTIFILSSFDQIRPGIPLWLILGKTKEANLCWNPNMINDRNSS